MSVTAYYLATTVVDIFWVLVSPAVFLAVYYHLTLPQTPFSMFYAAGMRPALPAAAAAQCSAWWGSRCPRADGSGCCKPISHW
jgi:hypothetical protein